MANIKLNANEWNSLKQDEQDKITEILKSSGLLGHGDSITADASMAPAIAALGAVKPAINLCKIACDTGEAVAVAACATLPPPANAVCVIAAHAAGDLCRSKC